MKIRDDINLKELGKFGFKECYDYFYYPKARLQSDVCVSKKTKTISLVECDDFIRVIKGEKNIIQVNVQRDRRTKTLNEIPIIKDLIKADLVEKV